MHYWTNRSVGLCIIQQLLECQTDGRQEENDRISVSIRSDLDRSSKDFRRLPPLVWTSSFGSSCHPIKHSGESGWKVKRGVQVLFIHALFSLVCYVNVFPHKENQEKVADNSRCSCLYVLSPLGSFILVVSMGLICIQLACAFNPPRYGNAYTAFLLEILTYYSTKTKTQTNKNIHVFMRKRHFAEKSTAMFALFVIVWSGMETKTVISNEN